MITTPKLLSLSLYVAWAYTPTFAFRTQPLKIHEKHRQSRCPLKSSNDESAVIVTTLTEEMGKTMLEWPCVEKTKGFSERYDGGEEFYVFEGKATIYVSEFLNGKISMKACTLQY